MTQRVDGRKLRGDRTREAVLTAAVAQASVEGLAGLSLGQLAVECGVSKSALFAHWPDKGSLQLAVIEHARRQWQEQIIRPALQAPAGVRRILALHEARTAFNVGGTLPGGCFFHAVYTDFDDKPGRVKDRLAEIKTEWLDFVRSTVDRAVELGELKPDVDPALLAFEVDAFGEAVVSRVRLVNRDPGVQFARQAVLQRLRALSPDPSILPEA